MIITKHKPLDEILDSLKGSSSVFLVGCNLCATTCKTGGEDELKKMAEVLKEKKKKVTGYVVLDPACNALEVKRFLRKYADEIKASDCILCFACGGGTQALSENTAEKRVFPGNDTLFQGEVTKSDLKKREFQERCSMCGDCMLAFTGGICPVTRCPKGLVNGPCGGISGGKCEVDQDLDCVWVMIYEKLKKEKRVGEMKVIRGPKDHTKRKKPQHLRVDLK